LAQQALLEMHEDYYSGGTQKDDAPEPPKEESK
jgi:hypothetical protein